MCCKSAPKIIAKVRQKCLQKFSKNLCKSAPKKNCFPKMCRKCLQKCTKALQKWSKNLCKRSLQKCAKALQKCAKNLCKGAPMCCKSAPKIFAKVRQNLCKISVFQNLLFNAKEANEMNCFFLFPY